MNARVFGAVARTSRGLRRWQFNRGDVAVPWPWAAAGGADGSRIDGSGLIVPASAPRINVGQGVLVEEARENLLLRSNALDTSPWLSPGSNVTVSSDATLFRGLTFWKLAKANTISSANLSQTVAISATAGGYALTIALLAGNSTQVGFGLLGGVSSWGANTASIRSGPGTVSTASGYTTVTGLSTTTPTVVELIKTATAGEAITLFLYPGTPSSTTSGAYNYFCPMNVEIGSFSTSYIPTTSASVTRTADSLTCTNLAALDLDGDEWTVIVTAQEPTVATPTPDYATVFRVDGAGGSYVHLYQGSDGNFVAETFDGATYESVLLPAGTPGAMRRFAVGFSRLAGLIRAGATGAAIAEQQADGLMTFPAQTTARVGSGVAGRQINGIVQQVATAPRLLSAAEIIQEIES